MGGFFGLSGTITINDVWFVHERGVRVGLWNMAGIASINIAPVISGYIITDLGWRWSFWILAISYGIVLIFVAFFMPETSFDRASLDTVDKAVAVENQISTEDIDDSKDLEKSSQNIDKSIDITVVEISKWKRALGIQPQCTRGQGSILANLLNPFLLLRAPAVIWSCAMWSVCFTWLIIQASIAQQVFGAPPYNMNSINVGIFIGCAPLTGAVLGTLTAGIASDWIAKTMALRNNGVYEPEFRLLIMIPFLITWCIGIFGLGTSLSNGLSKVGKSRFSVQVLILYHQEKTTNHGISVCGTFLAILNFAVGVGCTGIVTYTNDVCRKHAAESFGITMVRTSFPA
jgi:MFS family permease